MSEPHGHPPYNRRFGLAFVRHPEPTGLFNNSNQMVARWLEQLGCRIDRPAILSAWTLPRAPR